MLHFSCNRSRFSRFNMPDVVVRTFVYSRQTRYFITTRTSQCNERHNAANFSYTQYRIIVLYANLTLAHTECTFQKRGNNHIPFIRLGMVYPCCIIALHVRVSSTTSRTSDLRRFLLSSPVTIGFNYVATIAARNYNFTYLSVNARASAKNTYYNL